MMQLILQDHVNPLGDPGGFVISWFGWLTVEPRKGDEAVLGSGIPGRVYAAG